MGRVVEERVKAQGEREREMERERERERESGGGRAREEAIIQGMRDSYGVGAWIAMHYWEGRGGTEHTGSCLTLYFYPTATPYYTPCTLSAMSTGPPSLRVIRYLDCYVLPYSLSSHHMHF